MKTTHWKTAGEEAKQCFKTFSLSLWGLSMLILFITAPRDFIHISLIQHQIFDYHIIFIIFYLITKVPLYQIFDYHIIVIIFYLITKVPLYQIFKLSH